MEGTKNTMNEIIDELVKNVNTLKQTHDDEFCGEGVNITDELPSMDEALKLRQTMEKIKEIYEWSDDLDDENIFLDVIRNREEIYDKYYDQPDIKEKYESLKEEYEKLNKKSDELRGLKLKAGLELVNISQKKDTRISELEAENEELKGKQVWLERDLKMMIDVYEYADDLWREDAARPKICVREPPEILSMMKYLRDEIPDKKGKKLSPKDKEVLKRIRDSIKPGPDDVCGKEEYKLLNRLLK